MGQAQLLCAAPRHKWPQIAAFLQCGALVLQHGVPYGLVEFYAVLPRQMILENLCIPWLRLSHPGVAQRHGDGRGRERELRGEAALHEYHHQLRTGLPADF